MKFNQLLILICLSLLNVSVKAADAEASINWADIRQLALPLSGIVKKVAVSPGDYVEAGKEMLSLDCDLYQAKLKQSKAIVDGLQPAVETAQKDKELANELFDRTVLSEVEHRKAELDFIETTSQYNAALAIYEENKWKVGHCSLVADRSLIVLDVHISEGELLNLKTSNAVLITVASRNKMSAIANIERLKSKSIKTGKDVSVNVAGKTYAGRVVAVSFSAGNSASYSISGSSANSVQVRAEFNVFDPQLIGYKGAKLIIQ